jgi:hypothetical protein
MWGCASPPSARPDVELLSLTLSCSPPFSLPPRLSLFSLSPSSGLAGYKLHRRIGDLKEFEFDLIDCSPNIPITIGIHGWLNNDTDSPWKVWNRPLMGAVNDGGEMVRALLHDPLVQ